MPSYYNTYRPIINGDGENIPERYSTLDINFYMQNVSKRTKAKVEKLIFITFAEEVRSILTEEDLEDGAYVDIQVRNWDKII